MNTLNIYSLTSSFVLNPTILVPMDFQIKNPLDLHTGNVDNFLGECIFNDLHIIILSLSSHHGWDHTERETSGPWTTLLT